jgi:hypothetical protein
MYKKTTIGIDIDDKKQGKELLGLLRALKIQGIYRPSSSRRGYHFSIKTKKTTKREQLLIRYMFGDCYGRWLGDVRRYKHGAEHFNILFDKKKGKKAGAWRKI